MRAVILGVLGQLGAELSRQLQHAIAFDRSQLDITQSPRVRDTLAALLPDVVFNATSFNRVDAAELDPKEAFAINALAVRDLANVCRDLGCRLVHFSTNYVFGRDVERRTPYREDDAVGPLNAYGVSKLMGEDFCLAANPDNLVIRTAALFGRANRSRHNFLENMLAKAKAGETVRIVNDQTVAPTRTIDLARAAIQMVQSGQRGVFHVNGPDTATWFELAREYLSLAGLGDRVRPATSAEIGAPARRPAYSVMDIAKIQSLGLTPMAWKDAVKDYWQNRDAI